MSTKAPAAADKRPLQIIRKPALRQRLGGCSDHHIDNLRDQPDFPQPIRMTARSIGWLEHEVDAWIERRMRERDQSRDEEKAEHLSAPPAVRHRLRMERECEAADSPA